MSRTTSVVQLNDPKATDLVVASARAAIVPAAVAVDRVMELPVVTETATVLTRANSDLVETMTVRAPVAAVHAIPRPAEVVIADQISVGTASGDRATAGTGTVNVARMAADRATAGRMIAVMMVDAAVITVDVEVVEETIVARTAVIVTDAAIALAMAIAGRRAVTAAVPQVIVASPAVVTADPHRAETAIGGPATAARTIVARTVAAIETVVPISVVMAIGGPIRAVGRISVVMMIGVAPPAVARMTVARIAAATGIVVRMTGVRMATARTVVETVIVVRTLVAIVIVVRMTGVRMATARTVVAIVIGARTSVTTVEIGAPTSGVTVTATRGRTVPLARQVAPDGHATNLIDHVARRHRYRMDLSRRCSIARCCVTSTRWGRRPTRLRCI